MRREYSLRRRLVIAMSLVFLLGLGGSAGYYYFEVYKVSQDLHERTLQSQARELLDELTISEAGEVRLTLNPTLADLYARKDSTFFYTLYDAARRPVARSANLAAPLPFVEAPPSERFGPLRFISAGPEEMAALSADASRGYVLVIGRDDPDEDALMDSLLEEGYERFFGILVPFVLISLLIIWLISDWSLRPVARASHEATLIGPGNPSVRIATDGLPSEIRPLVNAVNGALERLAGAYTAERRLTADAAHELRTPLAVLNLRLQQAKMKNVLDWPTIEREIANMNRLVNQLLDLARKESPAHAQTDSGMVSVNLSRIVREAAAMVLPLAEQAGRQIEIDVPNSVSVRGYADDLRDMIRNLLDNALAHGGGLVRVVIDASDPSRRAVFVDVEDDGPGVPDVLKEELFSRFRKGRSNSPGAGLGLAIVRQVARSHGGDAGFLPGMPCRIRVTLPLIAHRA